MSLCSETAGRRFYRDADRAVLGGVCAGLARHCGLNLKVTRFLAVIAFFVAMPFAFFSYLAAVLLIPAESYGNLERDAEGICSRSARASRRASRRRERRQRELDEARSERAAERDVTEVRDRYRRMDKRLAELEKTVTSPRFQLEQEFRKL